MDSQNQPWLWDWRLKPVTRNGVGSKDHGKVRYCSAGVRLSCHVNRFVDPTKPFQARSMSPTVAAFRQVAGTTQEHKTNVIVWQQHPTTLRLPSLSELHALSGLWSSIEDVRADSINIELKISISYR